MLSPPWASPVTLPSDSLSLFLGCYYFLFFCFPMVLSGMTAFPSGFLLVAASHHCPLEVHNFLPGVLSVPLLSYFKFFRTKFGVSFEKRKIQFFHLAVVCSVHSLEFVKRWGTHFWAFGFSDVWETLKVPQRREMNKTTQDQLLFFHTRWLICLSK